ncbi:IS1634 family transposase, partial [Rhodococcus aetherivorans]|nr:IS1634 family transposase [Rhodococcus aetherivorans]
MRTKSGATAVQIARYVGGRQEIVKHIGSAHTDVELGMLLERARAWLEPDQQVLDLGVTPQVPVEKPLAGGQSALFDPAQRTSQVDAPGRTESTGSVL